MQKEAGLLERLGKTKVIGKLYSTTGDGMYLPLSCRFDIGDPPGW